MTIALNVLGNWQLQVGKAQPPELLVARNPAGMGSNLMFSGQVGRCGSAAVSFDLSAAGLFGGQAGEK